MSTSRRQFLAAASAGSAALLAPSFSLGEDPPKRGPNDKINLGFIGVGTMGRGHLGAFLGMPDVRVVAVCDVVAERRDDAKAMVAKRYAGAKGDGSKECTAHVDFQEILDRKDVDAVVIATPDHWHAIPCIRAARAKKDIYCEKPLTHNIAEGRAIVTEVAKAQIVFQTGSQQRSEFSGHFRKAVELVRNGHIGKVSKVRIGVGGPAKACDLPKQEIPVGTDWDRWLGPAPQRDYNEILCPKGIHKGFPQWRAYREYAGGGLADMGAHHFDIAQWALNMDNSGPVEILPPETGNSGLRFIYANGVEMTHGGEADCVFVGDKGTIRVSRGKIESDPADILKITIGDGAWKCYPSNNHRRNWVECLRSRKDPICTAEIGHRSATICHLGNIGYRLRKKLKWDPVKEVFGDKEADALLTREPRGKYRV